MRSCLIFILALVLAIFCFGKASGGVAYAQNQAGSQVLVTAYVSEHLSYSSAAGELEVATNLKNGLWLITENKSISTKIEKINIKDLGSEKSQVFIVVKI